MYNNVRANESIPVGGGDLLLLQSEQWAHPVLGIVQPWDPDYDLKYGVNFAVNQSTYIEQQQKRSEALKGNTDCYANVTIINIMVCVESSMSETTSTTTAAAASNATAAAGRSSSLQALYSQSSIGGWAEAGAIRTGVTFSLAVLGNTMTSIRECQALMSLRSLDGDLMRMVLSANRSGTLQQKQGEEEQQESTVTAATDRMVVDGAVDDSADLDRVMDRSVIDTADTDSVDYDYAEQALDELQHTTNATSAAEEEEEATTTAVEAAAADDASDRSCDSLLEDADEDEDDDKDDVDAAAAVDEIPPQPPTIPAALWSALVAQYNPSQLRAISAVCPRVTPSTATAAAPFRAVSSSSSNRNESALTLLQGPPGTGKTRTILGLVSVLLSGGLGGSQQTATKIIAGSSLRTAAKSAGRSSGSNSSSNSTGGGRRVRVLLCAPSNTAVDELVYRIITQGVLQADGSRRRDLSVIRVGQPTRDDCRVTPQQQHNSSSSGRFRGSSSSSSDSSSGQTMQEIVERVTLENVVDRRIKQLSEQQQRPASSNNSGSSGNARGKLPVQGTQLKFADIRKQVLEEVDIVCSTLSGAGSQPLLELVLRIPGFNFDAVIIDEAAQAIEPSSLIPFKYNPKAVVLVGDPCQLPATVFSKLAKKARLGQSLFQRLQRAGYPVLMLETQYRMHPDIVNYPSRRFYRGNLRTGAEVRSSGSHDLPYHSDPSGKFRPFLFHHCSRGIESREGVSICNREEALYVMDLFEQLVRSYPQHRLNIGIIAPYRAQRRLLFKLFQERFRAPASSKSSKYRSSDNRNNNSNGGSSVAVAAGAVVISINDLDTEIATVDGFQGREKDIIIFSCVRAPDNVRSLQKFNRKAAAATAVAGTAAAASDDTAAVAVEDEEAEAADEGAAIGDELDDQADLADDIAGIGFLREWQRLNVAITRAKYALWIVGNAQFLQRDAEWKNLIDYTRRRNCFLDLQQQEAAALSSAAAQRAGNSGSGSYSSATAGASNNGGNRKKKKQKRAKSDSRGCYGPQSGGSSSSWNPQNYRNYGKKRRSQEMRRQQRQQLQQQQQPQQQPTSQQQPQANSTTAGST